MTLTETSPDRSRRTPINPMADGDDEQVRSVFVYGTLRPGSRAEWNRSVAPGARITRGARLAGWSLFGDHAAFPYAIPEPNRPSSIVHGDVLTFDTDPEWAQALARFDRIEGYPRHYYRVIVRVDTPVGSGPAWVYTPSAATEPSARSTGRIESGDWFKRGEQPW